MPTPTPAEIAAAIAQMAEDGVKKASSDQGTIEKYDLDQLIRAQQFAAGSAAVVNPHRGLRFSVMRPPGSA